jgi:hypothetical protein
MWIEYVLNGKRKLVKDVIGKRLIKVKAAREVQGEYLTRDMADQKKVLKEPTPELDSAGDAWNPEIHVATKLQNNDGTWRKKPGAAKALAEDE